MTCMLKWESESDTGTKWGFGADVLKQAVAEGRLDLYVLNEKSAAIDVLMPGSP